jgi:hypothetical protein
MRFAYFCPAAIFLTKDCLPKHVELTKAAPYLSRKYWSTAKTSYQDKMVEKRLNIPRLTRKVQAVLCKDHPPTNLLSYFKSNSTLHRRIAHPTGVVLLKASGSPVWSFGNSIKNIEN